MNFNEFNYLNVRRLGYVYNYIQRVLPFVYDQSLEIYDLLYKLVNYANEIGMRNNDLANTFDDLVNYTNKTLEEQVTFINNFIANIRMEFENFKILYNTKYEEFTTEQQNNYNNFITETEKTINEFETTINNLFESFKEEINTLQTNFEHDITERQSAFENTTTTQITGWRNEIERILNTYQENVNNIVTDYNTRFNNYETTIDNNLQEYNTNLEAQITNAETNIKNMITTVTNEIEAKITDVNLVPIVNEELKKLLDSGEVAQGLENLYGSIIRITYWDTNPAPSVTSDTPVYHYNPDTHILTDCTTGNEIPILKNSIYIYNGYVYISEIVIPSATFNLKVINDILYSNYATPVGHSANNKNIGVLRDTSNIDIINTTTGQRYYIGGDPLTNLFNYFHNSLIAIDNECKYVYYAENAYRLKRYDCTTGTKTQIAYALGVNYLMIYMDNDNNLIEVVRDNNRNKYVFSNGSKEIDIPSLQGFNECNGMYEDNNYYYAYGSAGADRAINIWVIDKVNFEIVYTLTINNGKSDINDYNVVLSGYYENGQPNFFYYDKAINKTTLWNGEQIDNLIYYENGYYYEYIMTNEITTINVYKKFINNTLSNLLFTTEANPINYVPYFNNFYGNSNLNLNRLNTTPVPPSQKLNEINYERKISA